MRETCINTTIKPWGCAGKTIYMHTCSVQRLRMRRRRSKLTFFSSSTATENDATVQLAEATDVALDSDGEMLAKKSAKLEAADQS